MKNLITRSISGIVYIALIIGALYAGGWYWYALTALFTIIGTHEYQNIQAKRNGAQLSILNRALDMAAAISIWAVAPVSCYHTKCIEALLFVLAIYVLVRTTLSLHQTEGDAFGAAAASIFGLIYVAVPLSILNYAIMFDSRAAGAILWMFALIWINDTGAYCVGSTMGKHRLCERLSPKKSWEGFWGGVAFCVIASVIYALVSGFSILPCVVFGVLVSLLATWGDLFESMLKRSAGVKDAGNIIPGHGGVLDRIDSLLFVAPAAAIFVIFILV